MNTRIRFGLIIALIFVISGCSDIERDNSQSFSSEQTGITRQDLKTGLNHLLQEESYLLSVQQKGGKPYPATDEFTSLILEILKRGEITEHNEPLANYDVAFMFEGFQPIFFSIEQKKFSFNDGKVYRLTQWNKKQWSRYILKEINGEVMYDTFEKDILKQTTIADVNEDGEDDHVALYYNGDLRLKVHDADVMVMPDLTEHAISSIIPSHQFQHDLKIKDQRFLVGTTYHFTNKYGSTSFLDVFRYEDGQLIREWSSEDLSDVFEIKAKEGQVLHIEDTHNGELVKISLQEHDQKLLETKEKLDKEYFYVQHVTNYKFYDADRDGEEEVIVLIHAGHSTSQFSKSLFQIYDFNQNGIQYQKSVFMDSKAADHLRDLFW
ncbi:MAG: hypothetical protein H0Z32_03175 [Bacillaceae bacterium]|nr:hypothetical protein [Bacillaceae bacterium]